MAILGKGPGAKNNMKILIICVVSSFVARMSDFIVIYGHEKSKLRELHRVFPVYHFTVVLS